MSIVKVVKKTFVKKKQTTTRFASENFSSSSQINQVKKIFAESVSESNDFSHTHTHTRIHGLQKKFTK